MIVIKGQIDFGMSEVWRIADEGGRIDFWQFDFDLTQRHTFWSIVVGGTLGLWLGCFAGLVMFAYFSKCDPYEIGWVEKSDQLIPYLVTEIFDDLPGLAGLYIASIY